MIAGGLVSDGADNWTTEVVELVKTNSTPFFGQLPYGIWGAAGTMLGNVPIICGGTFGGTYPSSSDVCISFQNSHWNVSHAMIEKRSGLAGVQINVFGNIPAFWLLGGGDEYNFDSTEFIIQGEIFGIQGPKLPYKTIGMCAIKLSDEEIFVIGGADEDYDRNEVWIYNPQNEFARKQGPSLNIARKYHSCSTMRDGEKTYIVVVGGYRGPSEVLDSVEIYDPTHKNWHLGKPNS